MNIRNIFLSFLAVVIGVSAPTTLRAASHDSHGQHPKAISTPSPAYPFDLRKAEIEGAVLVHFLVTAQGDVTDPIVVKSTDRFFEEPVLNAVKKWKFTPGTIDAKAADIPVLQLITFTIPAKNPKTPSFALISRMQSRLAASHPAVKSLASTNLCFCGSNREFNDCHRETLFASR